ncbi:MULTISPECIES: hypothetical protein [Nocardia]|nr:MULTISPECIES: hypothetical protein [Nocardia]
MPDKTTWPREERITAALLFVELMLLVIALKRRRFDRSIRSSGSDE